MKMRKTLNLVASGLFLITIISLFSAVAAVNSVPRTTAVFIPIPITANSLKPPECSNLNLTGFSVGDKSGALSSSNLILGTSGNDHLHGSQNDDCIVGGAGGDDLNGNTGNDVLLGGPGDDSLNGNGGEDICYGGGGDDHIQKCEYIFP